MVIGTCDLSLPAIYTQVTHVFAGRDREAHVTPVAALYSILFQIGMYEEKVHSHMYVDGFRDLNYLCTTLTVCHYGNF